ncbi:uncharacterized protein At4g15970-like [Typha angustifolia]|uniref:uncharacterized protein At4g15970-like n=1 Tax=Typha angustifolia TaxID=59011 RepID=UPI003C2E0AA8
MSSKMNNLHPMMSFLLGAAVATVCILFYVSADTSRRSLDILAWSNATQITTIPSNKTTFEDLAPLLRRAANEDNTVILTSINQAWAAPNSLLDVFLESFHIGENIEHLLNHMIIMCVDPKAYERCKSVHPNCYFLKVEGVDFTSEKVYMSKDYIELVWTKLKLQRRVLELGYNFLFTDVDIVWFRNPFRHISVYADITTSSDMFLGDPDYLFNFPNTGFIYVKSSEKTIEALKFWHEARERYPATHEQNIFNEIKKELVDRFQVKIQYLDTAYSGAFCNYGKDLNKICTMHASCCVGLGNKIHDLRNLLNDWRNFTALPLEQKRNGKFSWRVPGKCIH